MEVVLSACDVPSVLCPRLPPPHTTHLVVVPTADVHVAPLCKDVDTLDITRLRRSLTSREAEEEITVNARETGCCWR